MRGQNMTDARARERLNVDNLTMGKAPSGYGWGPAGADGQPTLVALKGGPADMKQVGMLTQDTSMLNNGISSMDRLAAAANEILQHPGVAGISGLRGAIPNIPGTDAANAAALMQTMKSQVAFGVLQDMRNNSKTGGALGQVSDKEIGFLQSNLAALDKSQSVEQLRKNLQKIIDYSSDAKDRLMGAYNIKHGDNIQSAPDKPAANLMQSLPIANASNRGRKIRDTATGKTLVSNGMSWVEQ